MPSYLKFPAFLPLILNNGGNMAGSAYCSRQNRRLRLAATAKPANSIVKKA